ncbi:hypothetical protein ACTSFH_000702 [Escherichia coli]|nr:hypothetical protein [Escherichia coli]EES9591763.1 hypothetical protein [Escherichia coli]EEU1017551.1 hypothetical protein [Escherichia coli]EEV1765822.1 hypothetical protein [Escherichia coli]EEV1934532.1 hypothetical protein [Escherichia coli]
MTLEQAIVFPAPAGINRAVRYRAWFAGRVPRASGDKPAHSDAKSTKI